MLRQGPDFLFEISGYSSEVEIRRVNCIRKRVMASLQSQENHGHSYHTLKDQKERHRQSSRIQVRRGIGSRVSRKVSPRTTTHPSRNIVPRADGAPRIYGKNVTSLTPTLYAEIMINS